MLQMCKLLDITVDFLFVIFRQSVNFILVRIPLLNFDNHAGSHMITLL